MDQLFALGNVPDRNEIFEITSARDQITGEHHQLAQRRMMLVATSSGPTMFARIEGAEMLDPWRSSLRFAPGRRSRPGTADQD
jgi:hypothetical protein